MGEPTDEEIEAKRATSRRLVGLERAVEYLEEKRRYPVARFGGSYWEAARFDAWQDAPILTEAVQ